MTLDRERWIQLAKANAEVIRAEVTKIKAYLEDKEHIHFAEFWAQAREITSMFKTFKPLEVEERETLWAEFHALCEETRSLQEDHRVRTKRASKKKKAAIDGLVQEASALLAVEEGDPDLDKAQGLLNQALELMKAGAASEASPDEEGGDNSDGSEDLNDIRLVRADRESCWKRWVEVREAVKSLRKSRRSEVARSFRQEADEILAAAQEDDPHEVQEQVKGMQKDLRTSPMSNGEREKIRTILRAAWQKASERIGEEKQEKRRKHQDWIERMKQHLVRWETTALKNDLVLGRIRGEIQDLESRIEASSDGAQSDKMRGWIKEKQARIGKLESAGSELEEKIRVVRGKLGKEAPAPITELPPEALEPPPPPPRRSSRKKPESARRPSQPPPSAGLNLGEVLAQTLLKDDEAPRSGVSLGELLSEKLGAAAGADEN